MSSNLRWRQVVERLATLPVRLATPDDQPLVEELLYEFYQTQYDDMPPKEQAMAGIAERAAMMLNDQLSAVLLLDDGNGMMSCYICCRKTWRNEWYVEAGDFYIRPEARGMTAAASLLNLAAVITEGAGIDRMLFGQDREPHYTTRLHGRAVPNYELKVTE